MTPDSGSQISRLLCLLFVHSKKKITEAAEFGDGAESRMAVRKESTLIASLLIGILSTLSADHVFVNTLNMLQTSHKKTLRCSD